MTLFSRYGYDVGKPPQLGANDDLVPLPQRRPTEALHTKVKPFQRPSPTKASPGSPPGRKRQFAPLWKPVLRRLAAETPESTTVE